MASHRAHFAANVVVIVLLWSVGVVLLWSLLPLGLIAKSLLAALLLYLISYFQDHYGAKVVGPLVDRLLPDRK